MQGITLSDAWESGPAGEMLMGIAVLSLGAGSLTAYADNQGSAPMGERMKEHFAKRTAELHDKLKLNAAQEAA